MSPELAAVINRITVIEHAVGDRFPLYAEPGGPWTTTRRGSWTGGFWAGLLWLRADLTGEMSHLVTARNWSNRLSARAADDTDTRAMIFWYGAGGSDLAAVGARAVVASALPGTGAIPVGAAFGGDPDRVSIDSLAAIVALLHHVGLSGAAAAHTTAVEDQLVSADGTVGHDPGWARGQAWGLLGFAVARERLGDRFAPVAERVAERWLALAGTAVPPAIFGTLGAPVDTSAAVIAAAGLWTLGETTTAGRIVDAVTAAHLYAGGALTGGCYDLAAGVACAHELIWGTYFLAALLAVRDGRNAAPRW